MTSPDHNRGHLYKEFRGTAAKPACLMGGNDHENMDYALKTKDMHQNEK